MLRIPIRKLNFKFVEPKILHHRERKIHARFHFQFNLRRHAENMRVVLRKSAHAQQSMQHAAPFVAIASPVLGESQWKVAVAARPSRINLVMKRAVHRFDVVLLPFQLHWRIHTLGVIREMSAANEEILFGEVRSADALISGNLLAFFGELLDLLDHQRAVGKP